MRYVILLCGFSWVLGCISPEVTKGRESDQQQILVEAKFIEDQDILSAPRIMVINGTEACIEIVEQTSIFGLDQQVDTGVTLVLTPRIEKDRVVFRGSCRLKEPVGTGKNNGISTIAFHTREAFFEGTANSGELRRVRINHKNGKSWEVALKFTVMVHNTSHAQLR